MKVIDVFMFRDEIQMLRGRFEELDSVVARHVLVESPATHRGDPKPLWYAENKAWYSAWEDKITHVVADLPDHPDPWVREHVQRDAAMYALDCIADDDDVVVIADVDEFWPQGFDFSAVNQSNPAVSFRQRLAMYAVDWEHPEPHVCTVAANWGALKGKSLAAVRDNRYAYPVVPGGWHLTWLGGPEGQREKLAVTCHLEMTDLSRELLGSGRCYREGIHHTGDFEMMPENVDETWPGFIYQRECPESWFRPRPGQA